MSDRCGSMTKGGTPCQRAAKDGGRCTQHANAAGPNVAACELTLSELRRMRRLEKVDAAKIQAVRSMASALDEWAFSPQLWREYREALERLTADDSDDGLPDGVPGWLSSEVRNTPPA